MLTSTYLSCSRGLISSIVHTYVQSEASLQKECSVVCRVSARVVSFLLHSSLDTGPRIECALIKCKADR